MNHDIEHIRGVPEELGGEVEVAVLEGVPMVREALLLHRPTRMMLSADFLLAMDQGTNPVSSGSSRAASYSRRNVTFMAMACVQR